jgi:RNA polymerase sigma factor (sigma-70 family)
VRVTGRFRVPVLHHPPEVTTLVGPVPGGTSEPLADLIDRWTGPALSLARRLVADERIAEDVVQEAFLAYWRNPDAFAAARGSFGAWFLSLVHHKAVDAVRHEAALRRRTDADAEDRVRTEEHGSPDVADVVSGRMGDARVRRALEALPESQREALVLAYWGGFTQREIAARTGAPLGTVKTRMFAGMRRLHEVLDGGVLAAAV